MDKQISEWNSSEDEPKITRRVTNTDHSLSLICTQDLLLDMGDRKSKQNSSREESELSSIATGNFPSQPVNEKESDKDLSSVDEISGSLPEEQPSKKAKEPEVLRQQQEAAEANSSRGKARTLGEKIRSDLQQQTSASAKSPQSIASPGARDSRMPNSEESQSLRSVAALKKQLMSHSKGASTSLLGVEPDASEREEDLQLGVQNILTELYKMEEKIPANNFVDLTKLLTTPEDNSEEESASSGENDEAQLVPKNRELEKLKKGVNPEIYVKTEAVDEVFLSSSPVNRSSVAANTRSMKTKGPTVNSPGPRPMTRYLSRKIRRGLNKGDPDEGIYKDAESYEYDDSSDEEEGSSGEEGGESEIDQEESDEQYEGSTEQPPTRLPLPRPMKKRVTIMSEDEAIGGDESDDSTESAESPSSPSEVQEDEEEFKPPQSHKKKTQTSPRGRPPGGGEDQGGTRGGRSPSEKKAQGDDQQQWRPRAILVKNFCKETDVVPELHCGYCLQKCETERDLVIHEAIHQEKAAGVYFTCEKCRMKINYKCNLKTHTERYHPTYYKEFCEQYRGMQGTPIPQVTETGIEVVEGSTKRRVQRIRSSQFKINLRSEKKIVRCFFCKIKFQSRRKRVRHMKEKHSKQYRARGKRANPEASEDEPTLNPHAPDDLNNDTEAAWEEDDPKSRTCLKCLPPQEWPKFKSGLGIEGRLLEHTEEKEHLCLKADCLGPEDSQKVKEKLEDYRALRAVMPQIKQYITIILSSIHEDPEALGYKILVDELWKYLVIRVQHLIGKDPSLREKALAGDWVEEELSLEEVFAIQGQIQMQISHALQAMEGLTDIDSECQAAEARRNEVESKLRKMEKEAQTPERLVIPKIALSPALRSEFKA